MRQISQKRTRKKGGSAGATRFMRDLFFYDAFNIFVILVMVIILLFGPMVAAAFDLKGPIYINWALWFVAWMLIRWLDKRLLFNSQRRFDDPLREAREATTDSVRRKALGNWIAHLEETGMWNRALNILPWNWTSNAEMSLNYFAGFYLKAAYTYLQLAEALKNLKAEIERKGVQTDQEQQDMEALNKGLEEQWSIVRKVQLKLDAEIERIFEPKATAESRFMENILSVAASVRKFIVDPNVRRQDLNGQLTAMQHPETKPMERFGYRIYRRRFYLIIGFHKLIWFGFYAYLWVAFFGTEFNIFDIWRW